MASLRKLKKAVNSLADQLITECNDFKKFHPEFESSKLQELIREINTKRDNILEEINKPLPGDNVKEKFDKVIDEFQNGMIPILDKLVK